MSFIPIDYKACKPIIERILKQTEQELGLRGLRQGSPEFKKAFEKRARELAQVEKKRLTKKFNDPKGEEFYRLFEIDLKEKLNHIP